MEMHQFNLTILHTNDSHGHLVPELLSTKNVSSQLVRSEHEPEVKRLGGLAHLASLVKEIRSSCEHVLLVDAGDFLSDDLLANLTKGQLPIEAMNRMQYDAIVPGNHDVDFGPDRLKKLANQAAFPFLAANMVDRETGSPFTGNAYVIKEINGTKIGIYGLTYHLTPETTTKQNVAGLHFQLDFETIQRDINQLKKAGVTVVIILSHLGASIDKKIATELDGIDVIIGGHSHDPIPYKKVGQTVITQALPYYWGLGKLTLTIENKRMSAATGKIVTNNPDRIIPDDDIQHLLEHYQSKYERELTEYIGTVNQPLTRYYNKPSPADHFFGDLFRKETGSEIALLPGRGFGVTVPAGRVTKAQLTNLLPHQSPIYKVQLTGSQIFQALKQSVWNLFNPDITLRVGGLIQASGISFQINPTSNKWDNLVSHAFVNDEPIEPNRLYTVALNQLLLEGGHFYHSLKQARNIQKWNLDEIDIIKKYLLSEHGG